MKTTRSKATAPSPILPETANPTPETGVSDSLSNRLNSHSPLTAAIRERSSPQPQRISPQCGRNGQYTTKAGPTRFRSGTGPQFRLSKLCGLLSPIAM